MINWVQGDGFPTGLNPGDPDYASWWTVKSTVGSSSFKYYALFYILGIFTAIIYCAWKFYRKGLPLTQLALGVIIIIPCALFGGSFFGKLNADGIGQNAGGVGFWGLFAFWHAGMAIHGGVYVGVLAGVITFGIIGHYTHTSLWTYMDAIIPNILLGQAFGRWGNFFNHEVMGAPVAEVTPGQDVISWIPHYVGVNTQVTYQGVDGAVINGITMHTGHVYQMAPLFFYESIAFFIAWGVITFVIPNIGKWFGPKPWKKHSNLYKLSWKQTFLNIFAFWKFPRNSQLQTMTENIYREGKEPSYKTQPEWAQSWFTIWKQAYEFNPNYNQRDKYFTSVDETQSLTSNNTIKRYKMGKALTKANNPDRYWTTKSGCEACAYFLAWNVTRFACELQRPDDHLFIMFEKNLSLAIIMITALLGLIGMILTQTRVVTYFFRQPSYLYEKPFFNAPLNKKHWWFFITNLKNKTLYDMKEFLMSVITVMGIGILITSGIMFGTHWEDKYWIPAAACELAFSVIAITAYLLMLIPQLLKGEFKYRRWFGLFISLFVFCISVIALTKTNMGAINDFEITSFVLAIWLSLANFIDAINEYNLEVLPVDQENKNLNHHAKQRRINKFFDNKSQDARVNAPVDREEQKEISEAQRKAEAKLAKMKKPDEKPSEALLVKQAKVTKELEELEAQYKQEFGKLPTPKKQTAKVEKTKVVETKPQKQVNEKALTKQQKAEAKLAKMEAKQKNR